ncbi:MAG TPA: hypothetical protein VF762_19415 [Blastocatellia bacterium]|jgi:hypothetical protein
MPEGNRRVGVEVFVSGAPQAKEEFDKTSESIKAISKNTDAAMNGVKSSSSAAAAALGAVKDRVEANKAALLGYDRQIDQLRKQHVGLQADIAKLLADGLKPEDGEILALERDAGALTLEMKRLRAEKMALATETKGLTLEAGGLAETVKKEKQAVEESTSAWSRKTSMINTGQGALRGYDAIIQAVVRSFGGITLLWAIAIQIGSALLPVIVRLFNAKKDLVEIDKEQVLLDGLIAKRSGDMTRVNADIITSLRNVAAEQDAYQKNTAKLDSAMGALEGTTKKTNVAIHAYASEAFLTPRNELLQQQIVGINSALGEQEKKLRPAIDALGSLRNVYGLNTEQLLIVAEKLHIFNGETEEGARTREFFREQLEKEPEALKAVAKEVDKVTKATFDLATQAQLAALAIKEIKPPHIDFGAVQGVPGAESRLNQGQRTLEAAGIDDRATQARALASEIKNLKEEILRAVAAGASQADITRQLLIPTRELIVEYDKQENAYKKLTNTSKAAERIEEQQARRIFDLRKELINSTDAVEKQDFDKRRELIRQETQFRIDEDKRRGVATVTSIQLLYANELTQIARIDQAEAESLRKKEELIRKDATERALFMNKQREDRVRMQEKEIADQRRHDEFLLKQEREFQAELESIRSQRDRATVKGGVQKLNQFDKAELESVRAAFGFVSRSARIYELQLRAIQKAQSSDNWGAFKDTISAIGQEFITGGGLAQAWAGAIQGAFDASINNGQSFISSFGKILLGGMLQIFGQMAVISGSYHVAEGIARMATIWDFAGGLKEFLGGTALIALGAAMGAAGGAIANSGKGSGNAATGGASAANGGAASGGNASRRRDAPPTVFPVNSGSQMPLNITLINKLDRAGSKAYLEGQGVLTQHNIGNSQMDTFRRAVKAANKVAHIK